MTEKIDLVTVFNKVKEGKLSVEEAYKTLLDNGYRVIGVMDGNKSIEEVFEEAKIFVHAVILPKVDGEAK